MIVIRTLEGTYYEIPDDIAGQYLLPADETDKHLDRVRKDIRVDLAEEFKAFPAIPPGSEPPPPAGAGDRGETFRPRSP